MQSLFNLKKNSLMALASAVCMVAFTGGASANSVTLSKSVGNGGGGGPPPTASHYIVSSNFTVMVFANLMPTGGGQHTIAVSLTYDSSVLTATACAEKPGVLLGTSPVPFFGQTVGGGTYAPLTPNCGAGSPADGGLTTPGVVNFIAQELITGTAATSGTLGLGTITFHGKAPGPFTITSNLGGGGGFLGADFVNRNPGISLGSVTGTIIPEPTTLALLGLGILGLGLSSRRLRRR